MTELEQLRERVVKLEEALRKVQDVLENGDAYGDVITDTIWIGPGETLLDRVAAALLPVSEKGR